MVTVDWGARSKALRSLHAKLNASRSFILANAPLPVAVGTMAMADTGVAWDHAPVTPLTVTPVKDTDLATFTLPSGAQHLRLDFALKVTIGGSTATCLEFRQLFDVAAGGALLPTQYSVEDFIWTAANPPVKQRGGSVGGRRSFLGRCPLLVVGTDRLEINCEFVDVTELWWAHWAGGDSWGWYLDPDLGGRPDLLRVLAWTSGVPPLIWFAAPSDLAATGKSKAASGKGAGVDKGRPGADVVFFRPQAGFNAFFHGATEKGFLAKDHGDTTTFHLARWLLSPLTNPKLKVKQGQAGTSGKPAGIEYAGIRIQPVSASPIKPADPMDRVAEDVLWAFRLVGLEGALARSPSPDVVILPVGFDGFPGPFAAGGGYTALLAKDSFRRVVDSVRHVLWVRGAVGRHLGATPSFDRQLWITGHSRGNAQMFACLQGNAVEVDRIISYDATPAKDLLLLSGISAVTAAAKVRSAKGKTLKAIFVTTPNMWKSKKDYEDIKSKVAATKADVLMLPLDAEWDDYWKHPPDATSNPHLLEVLKEWDGNGLALSKRFGTKPGDQWLFWHEWAVHGGHLVMDTATPPGIDHVRTFFEDVLLLP